MSTQRSSLVLVFFFFFLLLLSPQSNSLQLTQLNTLISLSRSLLARVSASRAARGDDAGARRAAAMSDALSLSRLLGGFGGGRGIWSVGWDFARNYAWRLGGAAASEASIAAGEMAGIFADAVRSGVSNEWLIGNYDRLIRLSNSLFRSLLREFSRKGPLRDMVLVLQKEVTEGGLLKDCLEVGGRDLQGVFQIARELFFSVDNDNSEL